MALKQVTPQDRLLCEVKRLRRALDMAIAEYESETATADPNPKKTVLIDPETGKPFRGRIETVRKGGKRR